MQTIIQSGKLRNTPTPKLKASKTSKAITTGSDTDLAKVIKDRIESAKGRIVFDEGNLWQYTGMRWEEIPENELRVEIINLDGSKFGKCSTVGISKSRIDSIVHIVCVLCAEKNFFNSCARGINCQSGFIRFDAMGNPVLAPHHRNHRCRHVLAGSWQPGTAGPPPDSSLLHQLLHGVFQGDLDEPEKIALIGELLGSAALGYGTSLKEPKVAILVGKTAGNGKSQILDLARSLLPEDAISAISPADMADEKYRVQMVGKLLNARDELSGAKAVASEMFKAVVTGEPISGRNLYKPVTEFRAQAQHLFSTNELPRFVGGMDRGIRRRLMVLPFNRVIPTNERIEGIGRRIGQTELDLLLGLAVDGASRLIRQGAFTVPPSSNEELSSWIQEDPVMDWLATRVVSREVICGEPAVRTKDAHEDFKDWAINEGFDERYLPAIGNFTKKLLPHLPNGITYKRKASGRYFEGMTLPRMPQSRAEEQFDFGLISLPKPEESENAADLQPAIPKLLH